MNKEDSLDGNSAAHDQHHAKQDQADRSPLATEQEAVDSIIDDYLLCGGMYPPRGGKRCCTAGEFLLGVLDDEDKENILTAVVSRESDHLSDKGTDYAALCREFLPAWLRANYADLIEQRREELAEEGA